MISLQYGYVLEDDAQAIFLENILPQIITYLGLDSSFTFVKDENYFDGSLITIATDRNKFEQTYVNLAENGLIDYQQDIFFIGRDTDNAEEFALNQMSEKIADKIIAKGLSISKVIILLPAQCSEYWFRYEKCRRLSQTLENFEETRKKTIKHNVYGNANAIKRDELKHKFSSDVDIAFLAKHSFSFRHFLSQIEVFLKRIS
jgi:hypothetical protein